MTSFRAATLDDVPALSRLVARGFDARYGEGWNGGQLLGTMSLPGTRAELAIMDGATLAFALVRSIADEVELLLITVDPERRRQGLAGTLLDRAILAARQNHAVRMHLEVREGNIAARALYETCGFICVGTRKAYYRGEAMQSFDAVTMSLTL